MHGIHMAGMFAAGSRDFKMAGKIISGGYEI